MAIKFSVVLTVFNKEGFIQDSIDSVLAQTYKNFEVVIVNDGSTDRSIEIIKSFKDDRIKLINQKNLGVSAARNTGIANSEYDYIALIDGDDLWMENYLEDIKNAVDQYPAHSVFSTAIAHKYPNKLVAANYPFKLDHSVEILNFFRYSLKQPLLTSSSIVFKKVILKQIGLFNVTFLTSEDVDMWIRIGINYPIVFIKKVMVLYVYNSESLSNTNFDVSQKPKYDAYIDEERLNPDIKKYIDKNRYSLTLMSKIHNDETSFQFYRQQLDKNNLSLRKRLLLLCPNWVINILLWMKALKGEKLYYKSLNRRKSS